jgi:hypothetical protein
MTDDAIAYYSGLLDRHGDVFMAMCWTVVESCREPATVESVAACLGGDPAQVTEMPWDAAFGGSAVAHLAQAGPAVMVAEVNGFSGASRGVLRRLSEQGRAHSAFWNVNMMTSLGCAALGDLLVTFEFPDDRAGIDICALDDELEALYAAQRDPEDDTRAAMMAVVERRTGVRLAEDWLEASRPAIVLPSAGVPDRSASSGSFFDPELESALLLAPPSADRELASDLADLLVPAVQLAGEPEILAARAALRDGAPLGDERYAPLEQLARRLSEQVDSTPKSATVLDGMAWHRMQAAWALQLAFRPPDHTPRPLHSLQHARLALGDDWPAGRRRLRARLRRPYRQGRG